MVSLTEDRIFIYIFKTILLVIQYITLDRDNTPLFKIYGMCCIVNLRLLCPKVGLLTN